MREEPIKRKKVDIKKLAIAVAPLALVLTACASGSPEATVTVTATATETETRPAPEPEPEPEPDTGVEDMSESEKDETYLLLLSTKVNTFGIDEDVLTELGRTICMSLDRGMDVESVYMVAKSSGLTNDEAAAIIAAAIVVYCPQHENSV